MMCSKKDMSGREGAVQRYKRKAAVDERPQTAHLRSGRQKKSASMFQRLNIDTLMRSCCLFLVVWYYVYINKTLFCYLYFLFVILLPVTIFLVVYCFFVLFCMLSHRAHPPPVGF
uniref:Uncharacterized protein n=1 Tax=Cacopsylla melanoneura TaxID=428564 RepID=A0A8D8Z641_9HEMI